MPLAPPSIGRCAQRQEAAFFRLAPDSRSAQPVRISMNTLRLRQWAACGIAAMALTMSAAPRSYEVWTDPTNSAKTFRGRLVAVYGPMAFFETKSKGAACAALDGLPGGDAIRVADFMATPPAPPAPWSTSTAAVTQALRGNLGIIRDGKLVDFDPGAQPEPRFYLIYFSAGWCRPCHLFTPSLVSEYHQLRARGADDFEVIFVSSDESGGDMIGYMKEMGMPWPAVKWSLLRSIEPVTKLAGDGIPCLVVIDRDGNLLFHSFNGDEYLGADKPLNSFKQVRLLCVPGNAQMAAIRYRFERAVHLERNKTGTVPAKPYAVHLDPTRFRKEGVTRFRLSLSIARDGSVVTARVLDEIPSGLDILAESEARRWVFLPAIKAGEYCAGDVVLPVDLAR